MKYTACTAMETANMAMTTAQEASRNTEGMKELIEGMEKKTADIETSMAKLEQPLPGGAAASGNTPMTSSKGKGNEENRDRQIVIGGLNNEQDEKDIVEQVNKLMKEVWVQQKVVHTFTYSDPSNLAIENRNASNTYCMFKDMQDKAAW